MLEFSFKFKESTSRGRLLKAFLKDTSPESCDSPILLSNACPGCSTDVNPIDCIDCPICKGKFHIPCLTYAIPTDFVTLQADNPCIWWCCSKCVSKAENTVNPDSVTNVDDNVIDDKGLTDQQSSHNQVDFVSMISNQFKEFKSELMNSVNSAIEDKINSVLIDKALDISSTTQASPTQLNNPLPGLYSDKAKVTTPGPSSPTIVPEPPSTFAPSTSYPLTSTQNSSPHSSTVTQSKLPPAEVLVLSPISDNSSITALAMNNVKKSVEKKLKNVQVDFIRANDKTKKVTVGFRNQELRDEGSRLLNEQEVLASLGYESKNGSKMLPKISLTRVSSDIFDDIWTNNGNPEQLKNLQKEVVVQKILEKNPRVNELHSLGHTLAVVYINKVVKQRSNQTIEEYSIGLKVSPLIRLKLMDEQQGIIYLGNRRYSVTDRYYIKQCYHCQLIGHTSEDCPEAKANKPPVCMYCMGKHRSSACTNKSNKAVHCCGRCLASKVKDDAENFKCHNAASSQCPVISREAKRLSENTELASKNVM